VFKYEDFKMDLITTTEISKLWHISSRRVAILCSEGRITGVKKVGNTWLIPRDAEKPCDARTTRYSTTKINTGEKGLEDK